ncbi:hypothetical protein HDU93_004476, partial [Gonapodya sp. JEL0774]
MALPMRYITFRENMDKLNAISQHRGGETISFAGKQYITPSRDALVTYIALRIYELSENIKDVEDFVDCVQYKAKSAFAPYVSERLRSIHKKQYTPFSKSDDQASVLRNKLQTTRSELEKFQTETYAAQIKLREKDELLQQERSLLHNARNQLKKLHAEVTAAAKNKQIDLDKESESRREQSQKANVESQTDFEDEATTPRRPPIEKRMNSPPLTRRRVYSRRETEDRCNAEYADLLNAERLKHEGIQGKYKITIQDLRAQNATLSEKLYEYLQAQVQQGLEYINADEIKLDENVQTTELRMQNAECQKEVSKLQKSHSKLVADKDANEAELAATKEDVIRLSEEVKVTKKTLVQVKKQLKGSHEQIERLELDLKVEKDNKNKIHDLYALLK